MTFIQDWGAPDNNSWGTTETRTGPVTTAGNTLFADLYVRSSTPPPATVTITDDGATGSNVWTSVQLYQGGSTNLFMFICQDAEPVTSVTYSWLDAEAGTINAEHMGFVSEYSGVGELVEAVSESVSDGGLPGPIAAQPGQLVRATGATASISRTWDITSTGVTPTERAGFANLQSEIRRADAYVDTAGDASIGWERTSGSSTSFIMINAVYAEPAEPAPEPSGRYLLTATGWAPVTTTLL